VFIPRRPDSAEDDGYVMYLAYDRDQNTSELVVLAARALLAEPIARVLLPHRVPYGFHGNWLAAA
jgi:carotenoid cleavage dioxygenase